MEDKNNLDEFGSLVPERLARHWFDVANGLRAENERLKADAVRLTAAGEHLWAFAQACVNKDIYAKTAQARIDIWNAAKDRSPL